MSCASCFATLRRRRWLPCCALLALALCLLGGPQASATVATTGNVTPVPNVNGGTLSGPLLVGATTPGTMTITGGPFLEVTGGGILVGDGANAIGIVSVTGLGGILRTTTTFDLTVGNAGTGSVAVSNMGQIVLTDDLVLGSQTNASGTLLVADLGTIVNVSDDVTVGRIGRGLVQVTNGGRVLADVTVLGDLAGGDGRITVSGHESYWQQSGAMSIGAVSRGEVQILNQGRIDTAGVTIGSGEAATGVAVVSGSASVWRNNGAMTVGASGLATLNILDGARMETTGAARFATGAGSESQGVISGVNSRWTIGSTLTIGEAGFGKLDIRGGAIVTAGNTILGDLAGGRSELLVEGRGSLLEITGSLDVSDPAEAELTISNSGQVTTTGAARVGAAGRLSLIGGRLNAGVGGLTNSGLVQGGGRITGAVINGATGRMRVRLGESMILSNTLVNGGLIEADGGEFETQDTLTNNNDIDLQSTTLRAGGAGLDNNTGGQLSVTGGTVDIYGAVDNNAGGQVVVGGNATAVFHDALANSGQFTVVQGAQVLALENLSFTPTSQLNVQIGSNDPQNVFAHIDAAGSAMLAGALAVTLEPGYVPELGDAFELLTAGGGVSGTFATTMLPTLAGGLAWDVDYTSQSLAVTVIAGLTADFDSNGTVNAADLALWRTGFGKATAAVRGDGDADGDGDVDGSDFVLWQRQLGLSISVTPALQAVPEPASWLLAAGCCLLPALRRRGRSAQA